jgi:nitrogen fixation protein FixH
MNELTGKHVAAMFVSGFGIIIAVNLTLAWNAVQTFPGLEVKNSYVASQSFDADRAAQLALDWDVRAFLQADQLVLEVSRDGEPVAPEITGAVFSRATSVSMDQTPEFTFDGTAFTAAVQAGPGNWNLRLVARAADGTIFRQRIIVEAAQ